jgi:hypothetical protein
VLIITLFDWKKNKNNLSVPNATKLRILFRSDADSRATHPASAKTLKSVAEAPLLRGELRKTLIIYGSTRSIQPKEGTVRENDQKL